MKKMAIKGLAALAVVVALCMFFSGTIKTISTAKVKLVTARQGKLEEQIKLSGQLTFPETTEVNVALEADQSITVTRVCVARGRKVDAGTPLFEAEVTGYAKTLEGLQSDYDAAQRELLELESSGSVSLKRTDEIWVEAYDALLACQTALNQAQMELEIAARLANVTMTNGELPAEAMMDENLAALQQEVTKAENDLASAQKKYDSANRFGVSEGVMTYITKSRELNQKMTEAREQMVALNVLQKSVQTVTAPHDCYVVEINIKKGDTFDGKTAAMVISSKDVKPVLRADVSEIERRIEKGTEVTVKRDGDKTISKKVTDTGVDEEGKQYVDVSLSDKDVTNLGGGAALLSGRDVELVASYRAKTSTTLLPISAVRGSGEERYVYLVNEESNALGKRVLKVSKQSVTVLAEVGNTVSLEDDLNRQRVAYMEDRSISDGSEVMIYGE